MASTEDQPIPPNNTVSGPPEPRVETDGTGNHKASLQPESGEGKSKQESDPRAAFDDPSQYGSDLSPYNKFQSLRIWATGTSLRNIVDGASVFYNYRFFHKERWSIYLNLGDDENGNPIPKLRILIYLPLRGRDYALRGWVKPGEETGKPKKRGVVVHLAGGGFTMCRPENEGHLCRTLCDTLSSVVISPDYAKAPQHPFPVALNQCYALIRWIADPDGLFQFLSTSGTPSIKTFIPNVDPTRIALSGGSSGGNLAAALVVKCMDGPSLPLDARIVGLGLLYAMIDVTVPFQEKLKDVPDKSKVLPRWLTRLFLDGYLDQLRIPANAEKLRDPYLSPALCSHEQLERFPKTVVVTAENDYLCKEGEIFADRLEKEAGFSIARDGNKKIGDGHGKLWRKTFKNVGHGFDIAPNLTKETQRIHGQAREEAWGMICEAFDQELSERKRWAKRDDDRRSSPESSMQ